MQVEQLFRGAFIRLAISGIYAEWASIPGKHEPSSSAGDNMEMPPAASTPKMPFRTARKVRVRFRRLVCELGDFPATSGESARLDLRAQRCLATRRNRAARLGADSPWRAVASRL